MVINWFKMVGVYTLKLIIVLICLLTLSMFYVMPLATANNKFNESSAVERLSSAAKTMKMVFPFSNPSIKIFKNTRRLELWNERKLVKSYQIGLGNLPSEDKDIEGDHKTPEGKFYICTRNYFSKFHLFLGLSYPNKEDAERGLKNKIISKSEYKQIVSAIQNNQRPSWDTALGGQVGIHGGGSSSDWTWGCIALDNSDIEELWIACPMGTEVIISK